MADEKELKLALLDFDLEWDIHVWFSTTVYFNKGIQHELSSAVELLFVTHLGDSGPFSRISSVDSSICMLIISSSETLRTPLCQKVKYIFVADHRTTFDSLNYTLSKKVISRLKFPLLKLNLLYPLKKNHKTFPFFFSFLAIYSQIFSRSAFSNTFFPFLILEFFYDFFSQFFFLFFFFFF